MLVLSRKIGERILIGDNVVLTVLAVKGRQIRLGIDAPASMPIWREQLARGGAERNDPNPIELPTGSSPS